MKIVLQLAEATKEEIKMRAKSFVKGIWKIYLLITLFSLWSIPLQAANEEYAQSEILVKFKAPTKKAEAKSANRFRWDVDARDIRKFDINNVRHMKLHPGMNVEEAIAEANKNPNIEYAEPNYAVHPAVTPSDPYWYSGKWSLVKIQAPEAWDINTGSDQLIIAIIDTGVDYTNPDLSDNMWINQDEIPDNGIDDDNNGYIDDYRGWDFINNDNDPMDDCIHIYEGHGTLCAGIIGASANNNYYSAGICWNVKMMPLKILDNQGQNLEEKGFIADAIRAIEYATKNGAKILNNSYIGDKYSRAVKEAIMAGHEAGILFVACAGNFGINNDTYPLYPCSYDIPNIISVAASDYHDNLVSNPNWSSCYGEKSVHLAAPGCGVLTTSSGVLGFTRASGTSIATPHVSGVCGLIWAQNPDWTNLQVKERLLASVDQIPSLQRKVLTGGRLNAYNALKGGRLPPPQSLHGSSPISPSPTPFAGTVIFKDDMENDIHNWTTLGHGSLWHKTHYRHKSSNTSWYYGREDTKNYDTGYANCGLLISPIISLIGVLDKQCTLTFNYWRNVESYSHRYDVTCVRISKDHGSTWETIWYMDSSLPSINIWETAVISLDNYIGYNIIITFEFFTMDFQNNNYEGWYIDDVMISTNGGYNPTLTNLKSLSNPDQDSDGIYDLFDAFKEDPTEWEDTDADGLGNNSDWDDDGDEILDEEDAYPLDIKRSTLKNKPSELVKLRLTELAEKDLAQIEGVLLVIPEGKSPNEIKPFINIAHEQKTLVSPFLSTQEDSDLVKQVESIINVVIDNDYDGIVINEAQNNLIKNLSAPLHNRGKQLILSVVYTENPDLDGLYEIKPYIDVLLIEYPENEPFDLSSIEAEITEIRIQTPEKRIVVELPSNYSDNTELRDILDYYNIKPLWK